MALVVRPFTYINGNVINADENNPNENTLYNLVNGALDDANIAVGANIQFAKLEDCPQDFILVGDVTNKAAPSATLPGPVVGAISHSALADLNVPADHTWATLVDGTRAFTGDQSMGGNQLTNVGAPGVAGDAANKGYVDAGDAATLAAANAYTDAEIIAFGSDVVTLTTNQTVGGGDPISGNKDLTGNVAFTAASDVDFNGQFDVNAVGFVTIQSTNSALNLEANTALDLIGGTSLDIECAVDIDITTPSIHLGPTRSNNMEKVHWDTVQGTFTADGSSYVLYTVAMPTNGDAWAGEFILITNNNTTNGDVASYTRHGFVVTTNGGATSIRDETDIYTYNNDVGSGVAVGQPTLNISGNDARIRLTSFNNGGDQIAYRLTVISATAPN